MRLSRFVLLSLGTVTTIACGGADVTTPSVPPLSSVRFINALSDTGSVDVRAVDQVAYSPVANNLAFRAATFYQNSAVGPRHFRVFPTSTNINVTSQILSDVTVTLPANTRLTLLVTGSARAGTVSLWVIDDGAAAPPAGQVSVRLVNAAPGVINGYLVNTPTDPIPGSPTYSALGTLIRSPYVARNAGAAAVRVADAGSGTVTASGAGPAAPASLAGQKPAAGVTSPGTSFSVYYFGPGAPGSANAAVTNPGLIWFVDRNPCDQPAVAACAP
ncbi:MAG: hypothetical protein QOK07_551 [Gemmatimonadaceae bacterium]|jgi:hypothetical protein|nr:hypothetical protein [Gemmatimonadaceae bacterium]